MAFRFNTYGTCRAPGCNKSLRTNGGAVYCYSHASIDIRYGDPRQKRITRRELHRPLRAVARLRKRNAHADWHLMEENWHALVRQCSDIANSRDADLRYRRQAANIIVQIAESLEAARGRYDCRLLHHRRSGRPQRSPPICHGPRLPLLYPPRPPQGVEGDPRLPRRGQGLPLAHVLSGLPQAHP
jgi:hypothetical protein